MRTFAGQLFAITALIAACDKPASSPTTSPDAAAVEQDEQQAQESAEGEDAEVAAGEGEQGEAKAEKQPPKDFFTVATFNLAWAHDTIGDDPKKSVQERAKKDEDWSWKTKQVGEVIAAAKPDVIALHELGGHLELTELIDAIVAAGGPKYEWAYEDSDDPRNGHNSAILSRFSISNSRRLDIHLRRHVVGDVELPTGDKVTIIAVHAPEGGRANAVKARRNQIEALAREAQNIRQEQAVIVLGTLGSNIVPADESYEQSAAGMLAGVNTSGKDDDCADSAQVGLVLETTTGGELADRIFTCGLVMRDAETVADDKIVRESVDEWDKPWSEVPVDKAPHRDLSDHLLLVAEVELPKPPPPEKQGEAKSDKSE